jgi:CRISPR/Cas system CSM-associated protein Csm3 (group 7 of RAMP superfamily)
MHRFVAGTAILTLTITPEGPWMIRGQTEDEAFTDNRGQPNRRELLAPLLDRDDAPYIPGSSLKGVLRSTAERILRSIHPDRNSAWVPLADNPFVQKERGKRLPELRSEIADSVLQEWLEERPKAWFEARPRYAAVMNRDRTALDAAGAPRRIYTLLSPASQLFGCTMHAGLVSLDDAHAPKAARQRRSHVAVDRFSGGVGAGPFIEDLAAAGAALVTELRVVNFALWQIALLGLTLQELNRGYQALGGGTRKGQGRVRVSVGRVSITYAAPAYGHDERGVISPQARLAGPSWAGLVEDVPPTTLAVERELRLLPELEPQTVDWRADGARCLLVQEDNIHRLFRETSERAWQPWVRAVREEEIP